MDSFFNTLRSIPLTRTRQRWVGGVCGGIAARFGWDVTLVRLLTVLLLLLPVIGIWTYLAAWLLLPNYDRTIALEKLLRGGTGPR